MKTLPIQRDEKNVRATVECATGEVPVYRYCAYCAHCKGIRVGTRVYPTPQEKALQDMARGKGSEDLLLNAQLQFNTLVRDGSAIECGDEENKGFKSR
jgi:hypothetical protein